MEILYPQATNDPQNCFIFPDGFSREELDKIYAGLEKIPFLEAKTLSSLENSGEENLEIRRSRLKWVPNTEEWDWLYHRMMTMAKLANDCLWHFDLISAGEKIQYTEYLEEKQGHYDWHQDIGAGAASLRKISMTVQLSEPSEYEGGELEMWQGGDSIIRAKKKSGLVFVFPSYMMHRVTPVTQGRRRSFVLWLGGGHYR